MRILEAKIINRYADKVLQRNTTKLNKNDWNEIGKDLIPNDKTRAFYSKKIVMSNIELANSRIMRILADNGITENKPFELLKKAEDIANNYNIDLDDIEDEDDKKEAVKQYLSDNTFLVGEVNDCFIYQVF